MTQSKHEVLVNEVLAQFDFAKVADIMAQLGWTWATLGPGVPTAGQLMEQAREMVQSALDDPSLMDTATGGLEVRQHDGVLSLRFLLEEVDVDVQVDDSGGV